jgi:DNA-binding MarR family transcriptional regulator
MSRQPEPDTLGSLFAQVSRLEHARAHELLEELGLYRGQHRILRALWRQDGLTHTELGRQAHVRPSTISTTIQRMEKAGLVERKHDSEDQRVSRVYLSEAGQALQGDVERAWRRLEDEMFDGLTIEERVLLRRLFVEMRENLMRVTQRERSRRPRKG